MNWSVTGFGHTKRYWKIPRENKWERNHLTSSNLGLHKFFVTAYLVGDFFSTKLIKTYLLSEKNFCMAAIPPPLTKSHVLAEWLAELALVSNYEVKNIWKYGFAWSTQWTPQILGVISKCLNSMRFIHPLCDYLFKALLVISERRDMLKRSNHMSLHGSSYEKANYQ